MSNQLATQSSDVITNLVLTGDLSRMNDQQKVLYYKEFCHSLGLNPLTQPFKIMKFQGKEIMYATKDAADQLRKRDDISITDITTERIEDVLYATVKGRNKEGRTDVETGAVFIGGLKGENLANAYMKTVTKAKRRLTLSICGLNMPDETEIETIDANATVMDFPKPPEKRPLTDRAFGEAVEKIKAGDGSIIGKLRATCFLNDEQIKTLVVLEDANTVPA